MRSYWDKDKGPVKHLYVQKQTWGCGISTRIQTFCWSDDKLFAPVKAGERLVEAVQPQHQYCRQSRSSCSEPSENPPTPPFTGGGKGAEMQTPTWLSNILQFLHLPNWRMRLKDRSWCRPDNFITITVIANILASPRTFYRPYNIWRRC